VAEELRQGAHRLAVGVDLETVLVLEDLEVELLDDVVGLFERLQAGVPAVQEATGVAHQAVAGDWWDTVLGADPTASTPFLSQISALMSGPVNVGSFLNSGANTAAVGFTPAAGTEMWVPQTAATTGNAVVNGTIQDGINTALSGMTVRVAADTYAENDTITKPLTLLGANAGINPNTSTRGAETVITTAVNDPTNNAIPVLEVTGGGSNVTIDGFTLDGINPNLGSDIQSSTGVLFNLVSHVTYQNNIAENFLHFGISGVGDNGTRTDSGDNVIQDSLFNNMPGEVGVGYGEGVDASNNFYVSVKDNVFQAVRRGLQLDNFYGPNPDLGTPAVISGNQIDAGQIGIWMNLFYESAQGITIEKNTLNSTFVSSVISTSSPDANRAGLFFSTLTFGVGHPVGDFTVSNNNIEGMYDQGILFWNSSKSVTISGGTIDGSAFLNRKVGVRYEDQNPYYGDTGAADSGGVLTLSGVTITNAPTGIQVAATLPASDNILLPVAVTGGTSISGGTTGLVVSGATASATVTDSSITGNATGIDVEDGGSLIARNNFITGNSGPALLVGGTGTPSATIQDNDLSNNGSTVVQNTNSSITVDAAENYWGSSYVTPAAVAGLVSGPVNFEPTLTTGDAGPLTPGFQADTTKLAVDISSGTTNPVPGDPYTLNLAPSNSTANNATITQWVINWGDGTSDTAWSSPTIPTTVTHSYAQDGNYTITATATDELGNTANSSSLSVSLGELSSLPSDLTPPTATEGAALGPVTVFHFTDADPNATASDYVATVQTGDAILTSTANPSNVTIVKDTVNGGFLVQLSYKYLEELNNATFSVTVTDHAVSTSQSTSSTFSVADAALSAGPLTPPSATEGISTTTMVLVHFTDANPNATAADYTAVVHWGDGSSDSSAAAHPMVVWVVANPNGGFDVLGSHTYAEEASGLTFTVTVTDVGGAAPLSASATVSVASAHPTESGVAGPLGLVREQGTFTVLGTPNAVMDVQLQLLRRKSSHHNEVGLFIVDDAQGRIGGLLPSNPNYLRRAMQLGRWRVIFHQGQKVGSTLDLQLHGGERLMFYMVPNGGLRNVMHHNPRNRPAGKQKVFFADGRRNPDRVNHLRTSPLPNGVVLRWEDTFGGGDHDFNDEIFSARVIRRLV
jgi:hypothetical protein